jgi:23S rRNA (uracil1939-C5)-methyltransferase
VAGVHAHWNDDPETLLAPGEDGCAPTSLVYGKATLEDTVDGLRIRFGPVDPWPGNLTMAERMWGELADALAPESGDAVVDLGCGIGTRTLLLARRSGWALGVDASEDAARRGRENAALNSVSAEFASGPVADVLDDAGARLVGRRPLVVADTGRRGLEDADLAAIVTLAPRRVALIGTNPRALARDAGRLAAKGWTLRSVTPYDMAPHTPFVESVALLVSNDTAAPTLRAPRRKRI